MTASQLIIVGTIALAATGALCFWAWLTGMPADPPTTSTPRPGDDQRERITRDLAHVAAQVQARHRNAHRIHRSHQ